MLPTLPVDLLYTKMRASRARLHPSAAAFLACLVWGVALSPLAAAPSLPDPLLVQPSDPASITPDQAKSVIARVEALAAANPARKQEIDAYLIPFRRVAEPAGAPAAAAPAAPPKPYLILKTLAGGVEMIKAQSATLNGGILSAKLRDGSPAAWQKELYLGYLPWYTDQELDPPTGAAPADLNAVAASYDAKAAAYPAVSPLLNAEAARLRNAGAKLKDRLAHRTQDLQAQRAELFARPYDAGQPYTREGLAKLLLDTEALRRSEGEPAQQARLDEQIAPFRQHFENLLAGKQYVGGAWHSQRELDETQRRTNFEQGLEVTVDSRAIASENLAKVLALPGVVGAVLFVLGLGCLLGKRPVATRLYGLAFCLGPMALAAYVLSQARTGADTPAAKPSADAGKITRLLFASASQQDELPPDRYAARVSEEDLNAFLHAHLHFADETGTSRGLDVRRASWQVRITPAALTLLEQDQWIGGAYPVAYDLRLDKSGMLRCGAVRIGMLIAPAALRRLLWDNLSAQLRGLAQADALLVFYPYRELVAGEARLAVVAPSADNAVPAELAVPHQTPIPTAPATSAPVSATAAPAATPDTPAEPSTE